MIMTSFCQDSKKISVEQIDNMLNKIEVQLAEADRKLTHKKLMKVIMRKWIPAADCLI